MNHSIKSKYVALLIKFALLALLIVAIAFFLARGGGVTRKLIISGVIAGILLQVIRIRHSKSRQYDEVGYWSGIGDFDIGFGDIFYSEDDFTDDLNFDFSNINDCSDSGCHYQND